MYISSSISLKFKFMYYVYVNYDDYLLYEKPFNLFDFEDICLIFPEIFFGMSLLAMIIHGVLLSSNKMYPLIQLSSIYLSIFLLLLVCILIYNTTLLFDVSFFNNTIILDLLAFYVKLFILIASIICLLCIIKYTEHLKINNIEYIILILFAIFGLNLLCSANDLLTAYLSIELQSLSFYLLTVFNRNSIFSTESGLKYFILGSLSSSLFLFGASIIYGVIGTTNFEDFKDIFFYSFSKISFFEKNNFLNLSNFGFLLIISSVFFKLALAPFHIWSPDIYEGALTSSTIFFAVIPKLSLFCLFVRIFQSNSFDFVNYWRYFFVFISVLSIVIGSFVGLEQIKLKSLIAYSSISHMGYTLLAYSSGTNEGVQSLFSYLIIYILSGICLWAIFLMIKFKNNYNTKNNKDISDFVLLNKTNALISLVFSTVLLSLAGFPPFIGFYVKLNIFLSVIESSMYFVSIISILCSVISTFYYIRIIKILYFENGIVGNLYYSISYLFSIILSICFFLFIFLFVDPDFIYLLTFNMSIF